jgi:hypothetical protein
MRFPVGHYVAAMAYLNAEHVCRIGFSLEVHSSSNSLNVEMDEVRGPPMDLHPTFLNSKVDEYATGAISHS